MRKKSINASSKKQAAIRSKKREEPVNQLRNQNKVKNAIGDSRRILPQTEAIEAINAVIYDKPKTQADSRLITQALSRHYVFASLTRGDKDQIITHMKHYTLSPSEIVFEQGQPGHNFFVIEQGKVEVVINGQRKHVLEQGDSFGELALLHDTLRTATIRTIARTQLWGLDRTTFRSVLEAINSRHYQENSHFIDSVPSLEILSPQQKEVLVGALSTLYFHAGEKIVIEGDPGDLLYIIKEGNVSCLQKSTEIRRMGKGEFFGEQALLYNSPRTATVVAIDDVECVVIGREQLNLALGDQLEQIIYKNSLRIAVDNSQVLSRLNSMQIQNIFNNVTIQNYIQGKTVIKAGTPKGSGLWIILKGQLGTKLTTRCIQKFQCIGESDIINPITAQYDLDWLAQGDTCIAYISRDLFEVSIGGSFDNVTMNNEALSVFNRIQLLRGLPQSKLNELMQAMRTQEYHEGETIVQQDNPGDTFFVIKQGKVDVLKDSVFVRTITKHDYFGERSVLFNNFRSATIIARGDVVCWVLYKQDFLEIIDDSIRYQLLRRIELQDDNITLDDLCIVRTLGKGMFGNVFLVVHKEKRSLFALKCVDRGKVEQYQIHQNLVLERKIMMQLDHTFIVKLIKTFKDEYRIYFLLEFVRGMDLFDVLRELNLTSNDDAKFYIASLIMILEHLHERDIIYRDLKPENVMVDEEGYCKLIDFGTAKIVEGRTFTVIGTPQYMAPEVITGKGYTVVADYWSVGVMLFEFVCGRVPFGEEDDDPYQIYEKVLQQPIHYPRWINSRDLDSKAIIEQLLNRSPVLRLRGSVENLKAHPWFANFDWDKLMSRQLRSPYRPPLNSFASDITTALRRRTTANTAIQNEERQDPNYRSMQNTQSLLPRAWDEEFQINIMRINMLFLLLGMVSAECTNLQIESDGKCIHKDLWPIEPRELVGTLLIFIAANLANSTGIGGGGIHVPLLILIQSFRVHEAIPLSKAIILGGAIVAVYIHSRVKMTNIAGPVFNIQIIAMLQPCILFGTMIGVTMNRVFPEWFILVTLTVLLIYVARNSLIKAYKQYERENGYFTQSVEIELAAHEGISPPESVNTSIPPIYESNEEGNDKKLLGIMVLVFLCMVITSLMKGGDGVQSMVGIQKCSGSYWVLIGIFACAVVLATMGALQYSTLQTKWGNDKILKYLVIGLFAGVASGLLGIGGGLLIAPLMVEIGLPPEVATASSSLIVLFTSASTTVQFFIAGVLRMDYAIFYSVISMMASFTGLMIIQNLVAHYKRASIILFALALVITISTIFLPMFELSRHDLHMIGFGSICQQFKFQQIKNAIEKRSIQSCNFLYSQWFITISTYALKGLSKIFFKVQYI